MKDTYHGMEYGDLVFIGQMHGDNLLAFAGTYFTYDLMEAMPLTQVHADSIIEGLRDEYVPRIMDELEIYPVRDLCRFVYEVRALTKRSIPDLSCGVRWIPNDVQLGVGQFLDLDEAQVFLRKKKGEFLVWHQERITEIMRVNFTTES